MANTGIDVFTYGQVLDAERALMSIRDDVPFGRFRTGEEQSLRFGNGSEIDGIRDYQFGDDVRDIDWIRSAERSDGTYVVRRHYADQSALTLVVSDIPTAERYASTPGNPLSSQALGFVAMNTVLSRIAGQQAEIMPYWSDGRSDTSRKPVVYRGMRGAQYAIEEGLSLAKESAHRLADVQKTSQENSKRFRLRRGHVEEPNSSDIELESLDQSLRNAASFAMRHANVARVLIVSDFRSHTDATIEEIQRLYGRRSGYDVLTVQITNPNLRELPGSKEVLQVGRGKSVITETERQRQAYAERMRAKQAKIDAALEQYSTATVKLDTATPGLLRVA